MGLQGVHLQLLFWFSCYIGQFKDIRAEEELGKWPKPQWFQSFTFLYSQSSTFSASGLIHTLVLMTD